MQNVDNLYKLSNNELGDEARWYPTKKCDHITLTSILVGLLVSMFHSPRRLRTLTGFWPSGRVTHVLCDPALYSALIEAKCDPAMITATESVWLKGKALLVQSLSPSTHLMDVNLEETEYYVEGGTLSDIYLRAALVHGIHRAWIYTKKVSKK